MYSSKLGEEVTVESRKRNTRSLREKGLPYGEVLKKFLVEPYMVKTAGSPPGKVNHTLQKGSTRNDCLTHEY